ncbi:MAG: hypothetical protein A2Z16_09160 [Chloroflexi bacterium RBG_16_54_18]|nr:MAG: hypothetical protein A2Z16_09160 [Chloroflexi bacterium RBG_16_54_18]
MCTAVGAEFHIQSIRSLAERTKYSFQGSATLTAESHPLENGIAAMRAGSRALLLGVSALGAEPGAVAYCTAAILTNHYVLPVPQQDS